MSVTLRVALVVASLLVGFFTLHKIRRSQMSVDDTLYWIGFSLLLILFSAFPGIPRFFSGLLGIQSESNFVFLFVIFLILIKLFTVSVELSVEKCRLNKLIEKIGLSLESGEKSDDEKTE